jgi:hypothetical protein
MLAESYYTGKKSKPKLMKLTFGDVEKVVYKIDIADEEYEICESFSSNMWANKKTGTYGRGLANTKEDPYKVERTGKIGELAFSKVFGLPVDFTYREGGDKYDFIDASNKTIDIKTSMKRPWYDAGLIRATNEGKIPMNLNCDLYVFAYLLLDEKSKKQASVILIGASEKEEIIKREKFPARKGSHLNYEVPYKEMISIRDLKLS